MCRSSAKQFPAKRPRPILQVLQVNYLKKALSFRASWRSSRDPESRNSKRKIYFFLKTVLLFATSLQENTRKNSLMRER